MRFFSTAAAFLSIAAGLARAADASSSAAASTTAATTTATSTSSSTSTSAKSSGTSNPDSDPRTACRQQDYVTLPFCEPKNNTVWRTDGEYYVTWDSDLYDVNSTVLLVLNYAQPGGAGPVAKKWEIHNAFGFTTVKPDSSWLVNQTAKDIGEDLTVENQTLVFSFSTDSTDAGARTTMPGPTIVLTSRPAPSPIDTSPSNRPPVSKLGLAIGLPLVFAFILVGLCGTHFCMAKQRQVGPIAIGGGRRHFKKRGGYSGRQARRARAMAGGEGGYRDEVDDEGLVGPGQKRSEWELASVKGGR